MNKMAIDPGKKSLGIYINKDNNQDISLVIKSNKNESEKIIFQRIKETIEFLIKEHNIYLIFIEGYAISKFGKSISTPYLVEIIGIIKAVIATSKICKGYITVPISTWKSMFKSLPKYKNKKYIEMVNKMFTKEFNSTDEVDAYLIMVSMYFIWKGVIKTNTQLKLRTEMQKFGSVWESKIINPKNKIIT